MLYWLAVLTQWVNGRKWSFWRVISFFTGMMLLFFSLSPDVMMGEHKDFAVHMVVHLIIGMLAPIFL